jgi:hypothetical protein
MDCATDCFCTIKAQEHASKELIQAIASCGLECLETARSCEVGSVLPELMEQCRTACEACIAACEEEGNVGKRSSQQLASLEHLKDACRECIESLSS